jgi:flagellar protein FlaG
MPRIDASLATQLVDVQRPVQTDRDKLLQAETAKVKAMEESAQNGADPVTQDDVRAAAVRLQKVVEATSLKQLSFGFQHDDLTDSSVVVIRDAESNEVIRQIPGDEVLKLRKQLDEIIGIMFDKQA